MKASKLIEDSDRWTSHNMSEDVNGNVVYWRSAMAYRFNLQGAIHHAYPSEDLHFIYRRIYDSPAVYPDKSLAFYSLTWGHLQCYDFLKSLDI